MAPGQGPKATHAAGGATTISSGPGVCNDSACGARSNLYAEGAVTDMQIGEGGDPMTAYIAVTRVKARDGLYIYNIDPLTGRPPKRDAVWEGLCCCRPGVERASTGRRCARATARRKRAASVPKANPKARMQRRPCGSGRRMHGSAENACVTTRQTIRPGSAKSAKHGSKKRPLHPCTHAPNVLSTACAGRAKHKCSAAKPESAFGVAAWKARNADRRVCTACASNVKGERATQKPCFRRGVAKAEDAFEVAAWKARNARPTCLQGMRRERKGYLALRRVCRAEGTHGFQRVVKEARHTAEWDAALQRLCPAHGRARDLPDDGLPGNGARWRLSAHCAALRQMSRKSVMRAQ